MGPKTYLRGQDKELYEFFPSIFKYGTTFVKDESFYLSSILKEFGSILALTVGLDQSTSKNFIVNLCIKLLKVHDAIASSCFSIHWIFKHDSNSLLFLKALVLTVQIHMAWLILHQETSKFQ